MLLSVFAQTAAPGFFETLKTAFPSGIAVATFFALILAGLALGKILRRVLLAAGERVRRALRGKGGGAFIVAGAFVRVLPLAFFSAGVFVYKLWRFPELADGVPAEADAARLLDRAFWIFVVVAQTQLLLHLARLPIQLIQDYAARNRRTFAFATLIPLAGATLRTLVVCWGLLLAVRVLTDTPPAEILAMIGIGGLALSLASQDTVKNFFGTAMLIVDRPFSVGDVVELGAGTPAATVVRIGLRSTRLRTAEDHEISFPNAELANRVVTRISARRKIRREATLGLACDTPPEKVEEAVAIVSEILNGSGKLAAGTSASVHFSDFSESSLNVRVVYAFEGADAAKAAAFAQETNLEILRRFRAAGIEFAFPARALGPKRAAR